MLEPGASFAMAADGGRPSPGQVPDLVLEIGLRDGDSLISVPGLPSLPSLGVSASGAGRALVSVETPAGSPISSWWPDVSDFSAVVPLGGYSVGDGSFVLSAQTVRMYGLAQSESVSISLSPDAPYDLAANVRLPLAALESARGVRTVAFGSAAAKFDLRDGMFKGCSQLESVGGATWMDVPREAFRGCTGLKECPLGFVSGNLTPQTLGEMCFYGCSAMPGNARDFGRDNASTMCLSTRASVGGGAFAGCEAIRAVTYSGASLPSGETGGYVDSYAQFGLERSCPANPAADAWTSAATRTEEVSVGGFPRYGGSYEEYAWRQDGGSWGWVQVA